VNQRSHDPRRLLALFLLSTLLPAASLGWLGWRMVGQDRLLETQRAEERRDQAAELATASLQRTLAEAEEMLTSFSTPRRGPARAIPDAATLVGFGRDGVVQRAGMRLPYYPGVAPSASLPELAAADDMELRRNDLGGALRILRRLSQDARPAVRAEVWLRIARVERKRGNTAAALAAFDRLGELGETFASGLPAGLAARKGRALIFESTRRGDELQRESAGLCEELESGRWMLTRAQFEFAYEQARRWLEQPRRTASRDRIALAEAAGALWNAWRPGEAQPDSRGRRTIWAGGEPVLALTRWTPDRVTALLIGRRFLNTQWVAKLPRAAGIEFALTDADGKAVLGRPDVPLSLQSVRPASATQLPWTLHAITRPNGVAAPELSGRTRLLLAGISIMALMLLVGGYFVQRAVLRELRVVRLQSDFVAAVSHEFRTPLTTLRQLSEMLARGRGSTPARRQQFYDTLLSESERLQRLVESLLNFGAMESGKLQYRFEPVAPDAFLREVVSDFEREVAGLGYRVELREGGALPAIRADRESLARVFWNLLDNAVKYSPESRTVWVDVSGAGKRLIVRVRDEGIGIPATERGEIFGKFVRGSASHKAGIRGTGVGLAMARQIVAAHDGAILVESEPGQGSVFTVLLPSIEA
jgi:signal transduction histidine kinase